MSEPKLDFSQWHPLDHWAFTKYCRTFHGKGFHHLRLWADYQMPDPVGAVLCMFNKHDPVDYWGNVKGIDNDPPDGKMCSRCYKVIE